jgi:phage terminase large subunit-like protein
MTKDDQVMTSHEADVIDLDRARSVLLPESATVIGHATPRIRTPLNDLPTRGLEVIDFAKELSLELMPWQKFYFEHALKVRPDGRWAHPIVTTVVSRQSGKSTMMMVRILAGLYLFEEPLQIASAHRLATSFEQFRTIVSMIEANDSLAKQVKRIYWSHGSEEIQMLNGNRFMIKAGGSSARGVSKPETVYLDELREMHDLESFASLRYTLLAAKNPQVLGFSSAGDQHSQILNSLRERAIAANGGAIDDAAYFEWSSPTDDMTLENAAYANPALGHTIHPDNLLSTFNDPRDVIMTEVLSRWVQTIQSAVDAQSWANCADTEGDLDSEKLTWLAIDLSPDRKHAALVGAQKLGNERFLVKLLHTWENNLQLDDRAIANEAAKYCRKYSIEHVAYSRRTSGAVAARLQPAGIRIFEMDADYPQSCDEMLSAINSGRLRHLNQESLNVQVLSTVKLPRGDGGMIFGRRASQAAIPAAVATALVTHFATRQETEVDIFVG